MAFETRGNGRYYYRKVWRNGACVSEYVPGWLADLSVQLDEAHRRERDEAKRRFRQFVIEQRHIDRLLDEHHNTVRAWVAKGLQSYGFHQHKRQWRMKRGREQGNMADAALVEQGKQIVDKYNRLHRAANVQKPKKEDVERLRQFAKDNAVIFDVYPMLAHTTLEDVLEATKTTEATKIYIMGEAKALRRSLGYQTATPLEKLLIEDIVLCWLRLQLFEQAYTSRYNSGDGVSLSYAAYLERRLSATQRRYLRAVESLARVRGLLARAGMQINIAQQQIVQNG